MKKLHSTSFVNQIKEEKKSHKDKFILYKFVNIPRIFMVILKLIYYESTLRVLFPFYAQISYKYRPYPSSLTFEVLMYVVVLIQQASKLFVVFTPLFFQKITFFTIKASEWIEWRAKKIVISFYFSLYDQWNNKWMTDETKDHEKQHHIKHNVDEKRTITLMICELCVVCG